MTDSVLQVEKIKPKDGSGTGAITIANSNSNVTIPSLAAGTIGSNVVFPAGGTGNPISVAIVAEQTSSGTDGGTFNSGSWEKRGINTEISDPDSIVSIGGDNKITLSAGLYFFQYMAIAYKTSLHQTRLYDTTGGAQVSLGSSMYGSTGESVQTASIGFGLHQPASSNVYELLHRCSATSTTNGRGVANNWGTNIFSYIIIHKLK